MGTFRQCAGECQLWTRERMEHGRALCAGCSSHNLDLVDPSMWAARIPQTHGAMSWQACVVLSVFNGVWKGQRPSPEGSRLPLTSVVAAADPTNAKLNCLRGFVWLCFVPLERLCVYFFSRRALQFEIWRARTHGAAVLSPSVQISRSVELH